MASIGNPPAAASTDCVANGCVRALQVAGLIDPIVSDFLLSNVAEANATPGTIGVVLELNSDGVVLDDAEFTVLARRLVDSVVPVTAWIGTGSVALGSSAELFLALDGSTMAPGSKIGEIDSQALPKDQFGDLVTDELQPLVDGTVGAERAVKLGAADRVAVSAGDHLVGLPGVETREVTDDKGQTRLQPKTLALVSKLDVWPRYLHTAASPPVAYLLLCIAVGLLLFEFFTAGIGVAGVVGAGSLVLAGYGLSVLPVRPWAVVLLGLSGLAYAVDVQAGVPRFWAGAGTVGWVVGTLWLFDGVSMPWTAIVVGIGGMALSMIAGMPAMVRSRFGTPTIGREWMIGQVGSAVGAIDPDGFIVVSGAQWRARTNRATPLADGEPARVVLIDGLTVEVEPLDGAAQDYRERRPRPDHAE